ncbi:MAG TPA: response regulator [Chthoniobacteraceae bacterium]
MPQPQFSDFADFLPKPDRRAPLPITNLPVNALTDEVDPTREIRSLIDQLQQTAKDGKSQVRALEMERDQLHGQLGQAAVQIEQFRAQFVEISALLRERDEAVETAERASRAAIEAQRRLEDATRERNDAVRQRDEATRQRDEATGRREEATRSAQEAAAHIADAQKQVISIRQARDAAQAVNMELKELVARGEDEIADLTYARETAQKAAQQAAVEISDLRRQLDQVSQDRDATARQVAELTEKLDQQSKKVLDLTAQTSAVTEAEGAQSAALVEAREQLDRVAAERDAERAKIQEQAHDMEALRAQIEELRTSSQASAVSGAEIEEIQSQLSELQTQREAQAQREREILLETASQQERLASLADQLVAAQRGREEALTSLTAAQKQIDHIIRERDSVRAQHTESNIVLEGQVVALQEQLAGLEKALEAAGKKTAEEERHQVDVDEVNRRFERQRVETIELGARLDAAQREILELTANLAEARLQAKFAASRTPRPRPPKPIEAAPHMVEISIDPETIGSVEASSTSFTDREAKKEIAEMRQCFMAFTKNPADLSLLNELYSHLHGFSERTRVAGMIALHRLSSAFAELTHELYKFPETVNPSAMRTVHQTIDFLMALIKEQDVTRLPDPAKAMIYVVDDDLMNCQAIAMAMETVMIRTTFAQEPAVALGELASGRFDLIFLDVNLPGMDGFQLCTHIRELGMHTTTPIVFLTGMASTENRVQSSLSGGNDFVAKPFNLHELSLKALTLILKAQLQVS